MTFFYNRALQHYYLCYRKKMKLRFLEEELYFIVVCSEIQKYEKKSPIQRVEVSRIEIFDHIVINHRLLKNCI